MTRQLETPSGLRADGDSHVSRSLRDTLRMEEIRLSAHRAPFVQMMIDLAAVVSIVVLACAASASLVAAGFVLIFVRF